MVMNHYLLQIIPIKYVKGGAADIKLIKMPKLQPLPLILKLSGLMDQPLVAKDYEYAYEIIANKATHSQRYTQV